MLILCFFNKKLRFIVCEINFKIKILVFVILTKLVCKLVSICSLLQQLLDVSNRKDEYNLVSNTMLTLKCCANNYNKLLSLRLVSEASKASFHGDLAAEELKERIML